MIQSILVYFAAILTFFLLSRVKSGGYIVNGNHLVGIKQYNFFTLDTILIISLFTLFCGLRYDVGVDYLAYLNCYQNFNQLGDYVSGKYEIAFTYLFRICNSLKLSPPFFFGFIALIQISFFLLAFRRERYIWPWIILFFFVDDGFLLWMNGLRQCIALCIWLASLYFIEEKKAIPYCALCLLATLFHSSAILLLLLYPILKNGRSFFHDRFLQYFIIIAAFGIRLLFNSLLISLAGLFVDSTGLYGNYLESLSDSQGYGNTYLSYWFRLIIYCVIIYFSPSMRLFYNSKRFNILYTLFFVGVISRCIIPFNMAILTRVFMYFTFIEPIMLGFFVFFLSKTNGKYNYVLRLLIISSFVAIFLLNQVVSNSHSSVWYQFYFNQHNIYF